MKIALISSDIKWESPQENLANCRLIYEKILSSGVSGVDLLVFPEFFNTGFSMNSSLAEDMDSYTVKWMKSLSREAGCAVLASLPAKENGHLYNRALFITPQGALYKYDKRHLFSHSGEDRVYTAGTEKTVIAFQGVNIAIQICYDLRFPVWSRNRNLEYDLMINVANWPKVRSQVTEPLAKARAIENLAYFAFVNRSGSDPNCDYEGNRYLFDFFGDAVLPESEGFNYSVYNIDIERLRAYRDHFTAWKDADEFNILK
ncbi:MAG: nitrilase-related carbon-nitrogen hydrolase [Bacteroidales bacterium]|nr:nitrilase-related carbon-nitrogen hydrolase [Bacteroidales bacterium]